MSAVFLFQDFDVTLHARKLWCSRKLH